VKPSVKKYFAFTEMQIVRMVASSRAAYRGRIAIVTTRGAGCDGRVHAQGRSAPTRTAKSCGPGPPTLGSSFAGDPRGDGGYQARHTEESANISRKPLRR